MRLKRLEILGFKSFADKTKLEFDPGITAIVGPNGCGKSNIADAFRWVLGEQSAKSMRGSKMPDVIFAGTTNRKPLNFAEVTITMGDVQGALPISYEEVSITRRLHRSGESEYFINKQPVRLKDVQGLFLDSGMGKDAYSIFEQGKIDQIINLSPLERRYIFEEAAGILRFLQRKKEALRKLEQTDQNVSRVKDIHLEVERQIIILEEQAEKARLYKDNKRHLEKLEKTLLLMKWTALHVRLGEMTKRVQEQQIQINTANTQIENLQAQLLEARQSLAEVDKSLRQRSEEVYKVRSAKEIKSKEKQTNQERIKELLTKEQRWQQELEAMNVRRMQRQEEEKRLHVIQKDLETQLKVHEEIVRAQRDKVKGIEEELSKLRNHQQTRQKDLFKLVQEENQCESEIRQLNIRLENVYERQKQINLRKERLGQSAQELKSQVEERKHLLDESTASLEGQKQSFVNAEMELNAIGEELGKTQHEIDRLHQEITEGKARQKALQRLKDDMEGFSAGSKRLLQEAANVNSPLHNKIKGLYEYFTPDKGSEAALASVMKPYAQTLVAESEADFDLVVNYIKQNKIKDISLICLEGVAKNKSSKAGRPASTDLSPLTMHVIENELSKHFLQGVYLAKSISSPLEAMKTCNGLEVWIGDGAFIDRRSVIFYVSQGENNVFLREAELKVLDKKIQDSEGEKQKLDHVLRIIQQKRNQLQAERADMDKAIRKNEMKLIEINFSLQKSTSELEKVSSESKFIENELKGTEKAAGELSKTLTELTQKHVAAKKIAINGQTQMEGINTQLDKLSDTARQHSYDLREKEAVFQKMLDEQKKQSHSLHIIEIKDLESKDQEKRLEQEIEIGRLLQSQIEAKGSEVDKILIEVDNTLNNVVAACSELEQQASVRKSALEHLESKISDKRLHLKKHENEHNQSVIQIAQLESNCQSLENELVERYQLTLDAARQECAPLEKSSDNIERQMRALRQQMEEAGDINMTSIEECEKHKTRYQFINQQLDDLNLSKQELVSIIAQLDGESRKIFKETFDQISENFKKNFKILFSGGEADLQFTETADVLEAGIEIIAKPPGKQMRSINLLSGGEKCLTAMALLFAIFEVKPAPFCILDEIDAPLDDTNVERFVNIVKLFVDRCQFIVITHNKRTMAIADILFGVSMEERGVSKLLSMDFSKTASPQLAAV